MRKKKDDEIGLSHRPVSQLPRTQRYVREYVCEMLGSINLDACFGVCNLFGHYLGNT